MADRYWVGGSGSWNSTTKWSTTSGGASGASVPTSSDNAIFDANSGASHYTVTVTDNATCADLTFTPLAANGVTQFAVGVNFVITGTFSTSGTQGNRRAWFMSSTYGLMRDMQIATIGTVTDVDFRDIRITGTGGTLSGTRIGDLRGCRGITFDTPKTVYWVTAAGGSWSADNWAASSGGAASTDNFPLAQDTAVIENTGLNTSATVTLDSAVPYLGTIDMSTRTNAMTLSLSSPQTIYGNWSNGSGTSISAGVNISFSGRNTQTITGNGKSFGNIAPIISSYGGTVQLADAFTSGGGIAVQDGTFDTQGYSITIPSLGTVATGVKTINLGSSTVTLNGGGSILSFTSTNLTFDAGTSTIICSGSTPTFSGGDQTFYNVSFTSTTASSTAVNGTNTFNNLSITPPTSAGLRQIALSANQTITGTLTVSGASPVRRVFVCSNTLGTTRTLTVGTLSADDCDFRDITIAGTAAGSTPTRAGDCGGNSGITFPAPKTVYWNLAGTQNWSATGWAPSSGGTPDINNFPLAQDTAVFDDAGSAGTITIQTFNIGTFDASSRTTAVSFINGINVPIVYGNWSFGAGVTTLSAGGALTFAGRSTQTITSGGVAFNHPITIDCGTGIVQLADAIELSSTRILTLTSGTFDAVSYNVTAGAHSYNNAGITLKMGSGTFTASGIGNVWLMSSSSNAILYKGTADILLSSTAINDRTFSGNGKSYNKLTIGGATGTSTLTITGNNQFTELASTKTVAHTIALGSSTQTFGKWTVTGTSGNVVTLTGTGTSHILAGACTSGLDYLAIGSIRFAATSPGEFYAGANSTATGSPAAPTYLTDKPADSTRYWVGGTGNWNDTNRWSTTSGGAGGADLPRSHDDVVFDSSSNATAYTATVNAITGGNRCKSLTIDGPASGDVTLAGSTALYIHDDITLPATGLTRTYTGAITLTGSTTGKTINTNGVALGSTVQFNGVGSEWGLGGAISSNLFRFINGTFSTNNYNLTAQGINSAYTNSRTINFGSSVVSISGFNTPVNLGSTANEAAALSFNAGTSQFLVGATAFTFSGNGSTFYDVSFSATTNTSATINGANTFNDLSVAGRTSAGIANISISADQTINGTLTLSAGTNTTMRTFVRSNTIGTTCTLTCNAVGSLTYIDFRDITIAGAAVSGGNLTGTRLGDCKGNSGITFDAPKTVYWRGSTGTFGAANWSNTSGGGTNTIYFPLAQDTAIFNDANVTTGATATVNSGYNLGTLDMSGLVSNTMTLATGSNTPTIYGDWINGTGTALTGTGIMTFAGRGSQTITSAGKTFTQGFTIDTPGGSVTFQDAFNTSFSSTTAFTLTAGTIDANSYNLTLSGSASAFAGGGTLTRTVAIGSGTWTVAGSVWSTNPSTNCIVTGTGTISLTSGSNKTFAGGGIAYTDITLDQGGAGTLTISGNNTFKDITNSYSATGATTIAMSTTTQRVSQWTATGASGNVLTVQGTSATSPATLILTGATKPNVDYLTATGIRAYDLTDTWYVGANSTNNGSLGLLFEAAPAPPSPGGTGNFFFVFI